MKNCFFVFCVLCSLVVSPTIYAQQPVIVEVPPMLMMNSLTADEVNRVGGEFAKVLSEIRIINKLALEKGMRDYEFQQRDWGNFEKTINLCEVLNIDWVLRPQLQKRIIRESNIGEIIANAVLINIRTKEIMYSTPVVFRNMSEATSKMQTLINEITNIINGASSGLNQSEASLYKVGDRGPAGGWIFYDKGNYSDGWRYLEVAPKETEIMIPRTRYIETRATIGNLGREIGTGKMNTASLVRSNLSQDDFSIIRAARICASLEYNWLKDWFLPSRNELSRLTNSNSGINFAELTVHYYADSTSTESRLSFGVFANSSAPNLVRAIRSF